LKPAIKPSVGRIVHYCDGKVYFPAIIIAVDAKAPLEGTIRCLKVFKMFGDEVDFEVVYSGEAKKRTWRWPEGVEDREIMAGLGL
jgi:hypothetical protein